MASPEEILGRARVRTQNHIDLLRGRMEAAGIVSKAQRELMDQQLKMAERFVEPWSQFLQKQAKDGERRAQQEEQQAARAAGRTAQAPEPLDFGKGLIPVQGDASRAQPTAGTPVMFQSAAAQPTPGQADGGTGGAEAGPTPIDQLRRKIIPRSPAFDVVNTVLGLAGQEPLGFEAKLSPLEQERVRQTRAAEQREIRAFNSQERRRDIALQTDVAQEYGPAGVAALNADDPDVWNAFIASNEGNSAKRLQAELRAANSAHEANIARRNRENFQLRQLTRDEAIKERFLTIGLPAPDQVGNPDQLISSVLQTLRGDLESEEKDVVLSMMAPRLAVATLRDQTDPRSGSLLFLQDQDDLEGARMVQTSTLVGLITKLQRGSEQEREAAFKALTGDAVVPNGLPIKPDGKGGFQLDLEDTGLPSTNVESARVALQIAANEDDLFNRQTTQPGENPAARSVEDLVASARDPRVGQILEQNMSRVGETKAPSTLDDLVVVSGDVVGNELSDFLLKLTSLGFGFREREGVPEQPVTDPIDLIRRRLRERASRVREQQQ